MERLRFTNSGTEATMFAIRVARAFSGRPLIATFESYGGATSVSRVDQTAEGCDRLPFDPRLRLIAGAPGLTKKGSHPPLTAILIISAGTGRR